jgi:hypothetical protein
MDCAAWDASWGVFVCRKAKLDAKNADGKTAAEVAELNAHEDVVAILKDA